MQSLPVSARGALHLQIDFINELMQAECTDYEFKKKWAEYEWENKVQVNTTMTDLY